MSANTSIEWTDRTWNPVRGCALVSEGCRNCYAMKVAHRFAGSGGPYEGLTEIGPAGPRWNGNVRTVDEALLEPLRWRKPQRIFVNSMSDLFHDAVPDAFIDRVFAVIALAPRHTFQVLTKRPQRMLDYLSRPLGLGADRRGVVIGRAWEMLGHPPLHKYKHDGIVSRPWPLPNLWLGVSCENQDALARIDKLKDTPAAVRFVSFEPLIENLGAVILDGIHWGIVGGESGPGARPCELAWIRSLVRQHREQSVACFVKQLGADARGLCNWPHHDECPPKHLDDDGVLTSVSGRPGTLCHTVDDCWWPCRLKLKDGKGGEMSEWADDLRVRQFPQVVAAREAVSA